MRIRPAVFLLMIALMLSALLNGQPFTNSLIGLSCALGACALALAPARDAQATNTRRLAGRIVVGLSLVLAVALAAQLPSAYRFQAGFNRRVKEIRRARAQRVSGIAPTPGRPIRDEDWLAR
jgi:hypothetical protein